MNLTKAAELLKNKTHSVFIDCNDYEMLKLVLKKAFPDDIEPIEFHLSDGDNFIGYNNHEPGKWANIGLYLEKLKSIKLSSIKKDDDYLLSIGIHAPQPLVKKATPKPSPTGNSFDDVVDKTLAQIRETLVIKGKEYRRNGNPFHNFEIGARKKNITREKVLDGFALKHEISIEDLTNDLDNGKLPSEDAVNEKFGDILIYLIIKKAMFIDRIKNNK